jgi:diaminohydroxyphosphoribosylaminopyrimidine deaminase/5-amino-6-(5-phosphoribosylamino)uracil reductase
VVDVGLLEDDARELNPGFVSRVTRGLPWVRCKVAASLDGRTALAGRESQWITGQAARDDGHAWRARACAVLTGAGTVLHDDPRLDVRAVATSRQPLRIIVDRNGDIPDNARILVGGGALIVTAGARSRARPAGVEVLEMPDANGRVDLRGLLQVLAGRGMNEIHVEAGARLNGALLHAGLVDEIVAYLAGAVIGDPARGMFELPQPLASLGSRTLLQWKSVDRIGTDLRLVARIAGPEVH